MHKAWLLLGSNEGNREEWLQKAMDSLAGYGTIILSSHIYITAAWGLEEQPDFMNKAICLETALEPLALLKGIQQVELQLGRQRTVKWGQRTLDIDILLFDDIILDLPELKIPHPHMQERRFVLAPLNDIAPDMIHPVLQRSVASLLAVCPDPLPVKKLI